MMKRITLGLLLLPVVAAAELYRWIDQNGRIHVGPVAPANVTAERFELAPNSASAVLPQQQINAEKQAAIKPAVVMYATSWCGYCRKARTYFKEQGIAYVEYDIEKDRAAYQRYKNLGGRGVPVISIGEQTIFGFSPAKFEKVYSTRSAIK